MEPTGHPGLHPEPHPEELEKFSLPWYGRELQNLFVAAAEAQRLNQPEFAYVQAFLQELSRDFLSPTQIQEHYDRFSLEEYRGRKAGLQRGTQEFFTTVEIGRWLRVCHDAIAKGQAPEQISQMIRPLIEQKLGEFGLKPAEPPKLALQRKLEPLPKPELPAGTMEVVTSDEADRILASTEIHGDPFNHQMLTVSTLRAENLGPRYKTTIDGKTMWFASAAYEVFDRLAVVAYVEQNPGQYTARTYYRSNSHGIWKYLPRYSGYAADVNHFNKGFGQESISLPWQSQKALAQISANRIQVSNPKLTFVGTARKNDGYEPGGTYLGHVSPQGDHLSGVGHTQPMDGGKNKPERVLIAQEAQRPNFDQRIAQWSYQTDMYGLVRAEVYASQDTTLQYVFCRDARNRVWIASIEDITSPVGATGLRGDWIDAKDLTTPAFDYTEEAEGYGNAALKAGNYYIDMYQNYISKIPVIQEYIRFFNLPPAIFPDPAPRPIIPPAPVVITPRAQPVVPVQPIQPVPRKKINPTTSPTHQSAPKQSSRLRRWGAALAAAVGLGGASAYLVAEQLEQTAEKTAEAAKVEQLKHQYDHIPAALREHLVGIPDNGSRVEFQPQPNWTPQEDGTYRWGDRVILPTPDGSALYIPTDTKHNKAFMLPPDARGNIDWHAARFPVQLIKDKQLVLQPSGLWQDAEQHTFAVLDGGLLMAVQPDDTNSSQVLVMLDDGMTTFDYNAYYRPKVDMSQIDTRIPVGFVDAAVQPELQTIQFDINFKTYDNTYAGIPVYPPDYKCLIPEGAVKGLAAAERELAAQGYHIGISEAKRPLSVQAYLYDVLPKGWAAAPTERAPHVRGLALDIVLLDAEYLPVFDTGFQPVSNTKAAQRGLASPDSQQTALAAGWTTQEYDAWSKARKALSAHGFQFSAKERWHVDYVQ